MPLLLAWISNNCPEYSFLFLVEIFVYQPFIETCYNLIGYLTILVCLFHDGLCVAPHRVFLYKLIKLKHRAILFLCFEGLLNVYRNNWMSSMSYTWILLPPRELSSNLAPIKYLSIFSSTINSCITCCFQGSMVFNGDGWHCLSHWCQYHQTS